MLDFLLMLVLLFLRPAGCAPAGVPFPAVATVGAIVPADTRPAPVAGHAGPRVRPGIPPETECGAYVGPRGRRSRPAADRTGDLPLTVGENRS